MFKLEILKLGMFELEMVGWGMSDLNGSCRPPYKARIYGFLKNVLNYPHSQSYDKLWLAPP